MLTATTRVVAYSLIGLACAGGAGYAQQANPQEQIVDTIRTRSDIGAGDQDRVKEWAQHEVDRFTTLNALRERFRTQFENKDNSEDFKKLLAKQTGEVAKVVLVDPAVNPELSRALLHVLLAMSRAETAPGLLAGLKSVDAGSRFLAARALDSLKRSIAVNDALLAQTIAGLREAALVESSAPALRRMYAALAFPGKAASVFDVYTDVFEKRLAFRQQVGVNADGAETAAWDYFRNSSVAQALDAAQKAKLAGQIAAFMRLDAERYDRADLVVHEIDQLERLLDGEEAVLVALGATGGGNVRGALAAAGHSGRATIVQEVRKWIGDADSGTNGALNAPPWNVPVGAP